MNTFVKVFKTKDLRNKIFTVGLILIAFRALAAIPIPGIDVARLQQLLSSNQLLGFLNLFSGGGLSNLSILMLGVGPYITATIIMQLLTMVSPALKAMYSEEGATGRAKFNRYSRYITVPLAALQGYGFLQLLAANNILTNLSFFSTLENVAIIVAGSMITMWLGEIITEHKIGNGISLIIFAGIVAGLPQFGQSLYAAYTPDLLIPYIVLVVLAILIVAGIVFIGEAERRIPVTYAKRVRGNKVYGGASSYLPLKVNQAGMIPIIFAISLLIFPQFFAQIMAIFSTELSLTLQDWVSRFVAQEVVYTLVYFFLVVIFTYFYTALTFNPEDVSKSLQHNGGFIPGIRPGQPTEEYLKRTTGRITLFGAIFLGLVAVVPNVMQIFSDVQNFTIGGAAMLIVVAVALEISNQINSQLVVRDYE